jgi:hypothetical protein
MKPTLSIVAILLLLTAAAAAQQEPAEEAETIRMKEPEDFEHAGIRLAVPTGYKSHPLSEPFQVMLATRLEGARATQSINLMAHVVDAEMTAEDFQKQELARMRENLALRRLEVIKESEIPIAGTKGVGRTMSYTFRGVETMTVSVAFLRKAEAPIAPVEGGAKGHSPQDSHRVMYQLTMEVAASHKDTLLRIFDQVVRSVETIPMKHPYQLPIEMDDRLLKDFEQGYALKQPEGWIGTTNAIGVATWQTDYLMGGVPNPSVQALAMLLEKEKSPEECGQLAIAYEREQGAKIEILQEGAVKLAGKDGYQFVIRKTLSPEMGNTEAEDGKEEGDLGEGAETGNGDAELPEPQADAQPAPNGDAEESIDEETVSEPAEPISVIEIRRCICTPDPFSDKCRHYALIVNLRGLSVEQAVELAQPFFESFSLFKPIRMEK